MQLNRNQVSARRQTYANPSFEALASRLERLLDEHADDRPAVRAAYRRAMHLELAFSTQRSYPQAEHGLGSRTPRRPTARRPEANRPAPHDDPQSKVFGTEPHQIPDLGNRRPENPYRNCRCVPAGKTTTCTSCWDMTCTSCWDMRGFRRAIRAPPGSAMRSPQRVVSACGPKLLRVFRRVVQLWMSW